ncbi:MAG TPA: GAF domain-containing protein, partial [Anaerolineaceae bacterium]|nr:GAF domain-containing protein [Anaerolineaceae bacterium]
MAQPSDNSSLPAVPFTSSKPVAGRLPADRLADLLVAGGYLLLVTGLSLLFAALAGGAQPLLTGLAAALIALLVLPARSRLQGLVERAFRRQPEGEQPADPFATELARASGTEEIAAALLAAVRRLQPVAAHLFLYDPLSGRYRAATSDLQFQSASPLAQLLRGSEKLLQIDAEPAVSRLQPERDRLRLLGARWYVPLQGQQDLVGWLAVSDLRPRQLDLLQALARQATPVAERSLMVTMMEKRIREMDGLGRVAQGVNVTVGLDDIFELIYAQTTQIIPADDFHLLLVNAQGELVRVFCAAGEDRLAERENVILLAGHVLEAEVIRLQKPLQTDDYPRECRQRNLLSAAAEPFFAWMSVPLNAGAETIGALSLARRDPSAVYTSEQAVLLQAIADQVAGAIVKTRLLEDVERRARQLATLNDVTSRLTSTLDLEPLLEHILHSAVEILNCEAGSLLLLDEGSGELVCRVTRGLEGSDLTNRSFPANSRPAGQAVADRRAVTAHDPALDAGWLPQADLEAGFVLRDALAVPLVQLERSFGVIEAYNRKDRSPFNQDDENLLSAFAAQAGVAIANARLYMRTDQALAARVEELSVMQRIDRELNTSLDTSRAMRITLEWAMRQSGADAGLVGMIRDDALQIVESSGYGGELEEISDQRLPIAAFRLEGVVRDGAPESALLAESDRRLLRDGRARIVVPIQRESSTVGLLYLESASAEPCSQEVLAFLVRLSDHASIAIANAQLYTAVETANVAKSEFVSFVAHELKNPMTSIKGYTELLAAGAVGAVNEAQANFLSTIKSNIDRMNTLVSDLNDLSKIEAGRLRLEFKALSLAEVTEEVVRSL